MGTCADTEIMDDQPPVNPLITTALATPAVTHTFSEYKNTIEENLGLDCGNQSYTLVSNDPSKTLTTFLSVSGTTLQLLSTSVTDSVDSPYDGYMLITMDSHTSVTFQLNWLA